MIGGADAQLPGMPDQTQRPGRPSAVSELGTSLGRAEWKGIIEEAVSRVCSGELDKVVLARGLDLASETPLDPNWLVAALVGTYPTCWTYHVDGLVGASPEMLIRLEGARKVMGVQAAVAAAREAGRKYISVASEILGEAAA